MIERAYREGEKKLGLAVWGLDQAGPFQTIPYPGASWELKGKAACQPHQYIRNGTAKLMTLFHPATGRVRVKGVRSCPNAVLHPWLEEQLEAILEESPQQPQQQMVVSPEENRAIWESWQEGLTRKVTLPEELPPLRNLLVLDNLAGHKTPELLEWLFARGTMVLYTPLGASWLNMTESIQRILIRRALAGEHPKEPEEIIEWLEAVARGWNKEPTRFEWGGKRATRRERTRKRRHALGGSGACTRRPIHRRRRSTVMPIHRRRRSTVMDKWQQASQMTH